MTACCLYNYLTNGEWSLLFVQVPNQWWSLLSVQLPNHWWTACCRYNYLTNGEACCLYNYLAVRRLTTGDLTGLSLLGDMVPPSSTLVISANRFWNIFYIFVYLHCIVISFTVTNWPYILAFVTGFNKIANNSNQASYFRQLKSLFLSYLKALNEKLIFLHVRILLWAQLCNLCVWIYREGIGYFL